MTEKDRKGVGRMVYVGTSVLMSLFVVILYTVVVTLLGLSGELAALLVLAGAVLVGAVLYELRRVVARRLPHREAARDERLERVVSLRDELVQHTEVTGFCEFALDTICGLLDAAEAQLTLYYDQPFALEVSHFRRRSGEMSVVVERVREDEPPPEHFDEEALSPETADVTELLLVRDQMIGLLLLRRGNQQRLEGEQDRELLDQLTTTIATGAERVMLVRRLRETNQRLLENEKLISIGQLASGIAHEVRNPLASIKMNLQGLKRAEALSEKDQRRVVISMEAIDRLDGIISELMSFARRTRLEVKPTSARRLVELALEVTQPELTSCGIEIEVELQENIPSIQADENRLVQVLTNLLINAGQAMETGGKVRLLAQNYGNGVEIQVIDQGSGIPEEVQREVFNPFFTTKAEGTGLGLANALKHVQEHGGELDFTTRAGHGTTFSMRLPPEPPSVIEDPSALKIVPT